METIPITINLNEKDAVFYVTTITKEAAGNEIPEDKYLQEQIFIVDGELHFQKEKDVDSKLICFFITVNRNTLSGTYDIVGTECYKTFSRALYMAYNKARDEERWRE